MQKDDLFSNSHGKRLILLLIGMVLLLLGVVAHTASVISDKREEIITTAADTCKTELELLNGRLAEWKDATQAVISSIAQENLFRVFLSDYASSESGLARFEELRHDINSQEYEYFHYLQDVLNDVARMHRIRNAALLLPDGRVVLGEAPAVDKAVLTGDSKLRIFSCTEEKGNVYARTATAVFPLDSEEKPIAYLVLDVPLDSGFAKVLSSETHHEMRYALHLPSGKIFLAGGKVLLDAAPMPAAGFQESTFQEENGKEFCMYAAIHDPADGFTRASIAKDIIEGREARAKWNTMLFAIMVAAFIIILGIALFFAEMATTEKKLNKRISHQSFLLQVINQSVENGIVLMERDGTVLYKNKYFKGADWERVPLGSIISSEAATTIISKTGAVLDDRKPATIETSMEENGEKRLYRVSLYPYVPEKSKAKDALSIIQLTDITEFRKRAIEQKRRVESLLDVFACAMESVDKGFRGNTHKMLAAIDLIRGKLGLSPEEMQTLGIAARLQSISKLFMPHDLVVKQTALTDEEKARIAQANAMASHMIQNFDFRLPVSATLDQMKERMDGTGKTGLKGDSILRTARVLAVVTSFCAMTSPRAYRAAFSAAEAIQKLSADAGYDQAVVSSLAEAGTDALDKMLQAENE